MVRLFRYGRWIVASVGAASATLIVANCVTASRSEKSQSNTNRFSKNGQFTPWDENWDRKDVRVFGQSLIDNKASKYKMTPIAKSGPGRRHIYLIREGQCDEETSDGALTKLGEEQAILTGQRLQAMGVKFDSIISSGMKGAIETAQIISNQLDKMDLKVEFEDPMLNEGPPSIPEPPYPNTAHWNPHLEEFEEHGSRIEAGFRKYFHRGDENQERDSYQIIVCHGNVIRYFSLRALQFPSQGWLRLTVDHSSVTKISILPDGHVILRGLGDSGHLPPNKTTA